MLLCDMQGKVSVAMLALAREALGLLEDRATGLYRHRREHPEMFLAELKGRRAGARSKWRKRILDRRIRKWTEITRAKDPLLRL